MAIEPTYFHILHVAIKTTEAVAGRRRRALGLGYPDLLVSDAQLGFDGIPIRSDSEAVLRWHGVSQHLPHVRETVSWFDRMGFDLDCIDSHPTRNFERKVDLNDTLPSDLIGRYDLVVDTGTLEHCFNVGIAFRNAWSALNVGGVFCHAAPMTRVNHGFWSFNPTVYPDFFEDNGGDLILLKAGRGGVLGSVELHDVPHHQRFQCPDNLALYVVARKRAEVPFRWPVQRKYRASGGAI